MYILGDMHVHVLQAVYISNGLNIYVPVVSYHVDV